MVLSTQTTGSKLCQKCIRGKMKSEKKKSEEMKTLEGVVIEVIKAEKEESVFKIKAGKSEQTIKAHVKVHPKILLGSKVSCTVLEHTSTDYRIEGFETHAGEPSPIRVPYTTTYTRYNIKVLEGDFEGIEYHWMDVKSKEGY